MTPALLCLLAGDRKKKEMANALSDRPFSQTQLFCLAPNPPPEGGARTGSVKEELSWLLVTSLSDFSRVVRIDASGDIASIIMTIHEHENMPFPTKIHADHCVFEW